VNARKLQIACKSANEKPPNQRPAALKILIFPQQPTAKIRVVHKSLFAHIWAQIGRIFSFLSAARATKATRDLTPPWGSASTSPPRPLRGALSVVTSAAKALEVAWVVWSAAVLQLAHMVSYLGCLDHAARAAHPAQRFTPQLHGCQPPPPL